MNECRFVVSSGPMPYSVAVAPKQPVFDPWVRSIFCSCDQKMQTLTFPVGVCALRQNSIARAFIHLRK